ncbi:acetyl-CoA synthetase-like protein, partial [Lindgomyces ingoldianus]
FDLSIHVTESDDSGCAHVDLRAPQRVFTKYDAKILLDIYIHVVTEMQGCLSSRLKDLPLFDPAQGLHTVHYGMGPKMEHDWPATLLHKIDEMADIFPECTAVKDSRGNRMTYSQLLQRVSVIATSLLKDNLTKGSRVAVYCDPSLDSLCSLLAITRIGCIYLPLDLRNPSQRLASIVGDCDPSVIIFHQWTAWSVNELHSAAKLLNISSLPTESIDRSPIKCTPSDPAFILYTSGSTGRPKGVLISHGNFLGQITAVHREFSLDRERVLQQSSLGFDTSLHQIFVALTTGGAVIIATRDIRGDPPRLSELMLAERVTFTVGVPSEYSVLLRYGNRQLRQYSDWKYAVCGGERMTVSLKKEFRALGESGPILLSCYGPTEVSLASSFGILSYSDPQLGADEEDSPVGFTLPNYSVYILDHNMMPVPPGFPGEIYIGGVGVACGYLHNDKLSRERFLPDPFASREYSQRGWNRMYRTGDKGRLLPDGALAFLGRIEGDSQVKLRGIRIELEEVSKIILETSEGILHQAAVIVKGSENQYMVAFVTFSPGRRPTDTSSYVKKLLDMLPIPIYMRPAALVPLQTLPLNVNGKLDRRALHSINIGEAQPTKAEVEGTVTEMRLKGLWEEVLGECHLRDGFQIAPDSDFFQVGGNSILLAKLQRLIYDIFGVTIGYPDMFLASVLREMAGRIDSNYKTEVSPSINWSREIDEYFDQIQKPIDHKPSPGKQVLLTGSTGFLGSHLLRQLVQSPSVVKIHAVAIRRHHLTNQPDELVPSIAGTSSMKIKIWPGDLRLPYLGLSPRELDYLADTVDVVIHNGADVSFLKAYRTLRGPNVLSTVELCRLALKRRIPFHFISSAGVLRLSHDLDAVGEVSMEAYTPPTDGSDGYIASKWASEQVLERSASQLGLRVHIHRPTTILGDSAPKTDLIANLVRFSMTMRAVPIFPSACGFINMVLADDVARGILQEVLNS